MPRMAQFRSRRGERGITVAFVAVSIFALVGMAALAIDLVTLYVAKAQAQRAADAGALAGAKTLVERGITADPLDTQGTWAATCVQATAQARNMANRTRIGGVAPLSVTPQFCSGGTCGACPAPGALGTGFGVNPQVQVVVQSTPLPLFFAKIWGAGTATVRATGYAEGFNASGTNVPVAAKYVMPWLLPNRDPGNAGVTIFDPTTGQITNSTPRVNYGPGGFVGEKISLSTGCPGGCSMVVNAPTAVTAPMLAYYPLDLPNPVALGPSCAVGVSYQQNIEVGNPTPIACGSTVNLDTTAGPANTGNNQLAIDCRIGAAAAGLGNGQDAPDFTAFPYEIDAGSAHNGVASGNQVTTSRSVVTIPVYDSSIGVPVGVPVSPVTVIGFVQAIVDSAALVTGEPTIEILNVSGCSLAARTSGTTPVGLGEGTAVPVRLIHP